MRAIGLDAGSTTMKLVGVDGAGEIVWHRLEDAEPLVAAQAARLVAEARRESVPGAPLVATGYGRALVADSNRAVTEITCHARGVFRCLKRAGTLIDIGGQDSKVVVIAADGSVAHFAMNDKCAAGTGRFLEVTASRLRLSLPDMAAAVLASDGEASISSTCTVFAESEIISLVAKGTPVPHIVRGLHRALIKRVAALARGAGLRPPVLLSGGVARSEAVRRLLEEELRTPVELPRQPQLMGAYGAALTALTLV